MTDGCKDLLHLLMERDVSKRLSTADDVCKHPFYDREIDWDLLKRQCLPPPFIPDPHLVYAKDHVPPFSFHPEDMDGERIRALEEVGRRLGKWEYAIDEKSCEWEEELAEYVKKYTAVSRVA